MIVTSSEMLKKAREGGYAVGAFNAENLEMVQAIITAAEKANSPVMIQTTPSTVKYASVDYFVGMVRAGAEKAKVPVCLHLDHGDSFELAKSGVDAGYTSIMIDGSKLSFEDNVAITKKTIEYASLKNIPVEAELGKLGGKEDDLEVKDGCDAYTDVLEAVEFVRQTKVGSLAIAIGTAHGFYKGEPKIDLERLSAIASKVDCPLVLHGGSGVPDSTISECIRRGISKVNYATELRVAYTEGVKAYMQKDSNAFDPKKYNASGRDYVEAFVLKKIAVCGSQNKA